MSTIQIKIHKTEWDKAAFALKHGPKTVRKATNAGIRAATKPIVDDLKHEIMSWDSSASSDRRHGAGGGAKGRARVQRERSRSHRAVTVGARHGLRRAIAASIRTKITLSGFSSGVRIRVDSIRLGNQGRKLPELIDEGRWRHPVMGNRNVWVTQTGKKGWFSDTVRKGALKARKEIERHVDDAMRRINNGEIR